MKGSLKFPPVTQARSDGLLAIGGNLETETLKLAYSSGVFPWPTEGLPLLWFAPPKRAILKFSELHIPKRYQQERKKYQFFFKVDQNFSKVIRACAEGLTRNSEGTWITPEMMQAYEDLHRAGVAHSFECYNEKGQLIGGLYGVSLGGMFAGESMFYWESGASKETLLFACNYLKKNGASWMDVQTMSPLLKRFGAKEIPREIFMKKLAKALKEPAVFQDLTEKRRKR